MQKETHPGSTNEKVMSAALPALGCSAGAANCTPPTSTENVLGAQLRASLASVAKHQLKNRTETG